MMNFIKSVGFCFRFNEAVLWLCDAQHIILPLVNKSFHLFVFDRCKYHDFRANEDTHTHTVAATAM